MIHKFDEIEPINERAYDVFHANGDYLGYCDYVDGAWYCDDLDREFGTKGTYYSDDHDDWLRMIEGLIEKQNEK